MKISAVHLNKGFTLIELLIVITIIGILAVALVPRISQGPMRARDVQRKADLQNIANAMELYKMDENQYPPGWESTPTYPSSNCLGGTPPLLTDKRITPYLKNKKIPVNPKKNPNPGSICDWGNNKFVFSYYYRILSPNSYLLVADLENNDARGENIYCDVKWRNITKVPYLQSYLCTSSSLNNYYILFK